MAVTSALTVLDGHQLRHSLHNSKSKVQIPSDLFCRRPGPRLFLEQIICLRPVNDLSETCF